MPLRAACAATASSALPRSSWTKNPSVINTTVLRPGILARPRATDSRFCTVRAVIIRACRT